MSTESRRVAAPSLGIPLIWLLLPTVAVLFLLLTACERGDSPTPPPQVALLGQAVSQDTVLQGGEVYQTYCQACHGDRNGRGSQQGISPHNQDGHTWHHPDHHLLLWTVDGRLPMGMPAFRDRLSPQETVAVLAFIKTWWTDEQRQSQADLTRRYQEALEKAR